jgi:hypothetical protein
VGVKTVPELKEILMEEYNKNVKEFDSKMIEGWVWWFGGGLSKVGP